MEKAGSTKERDVRALVRMADEKQRTLVVNMDRGSQQAVVVVATGKRAALLRKLVEEFSDIV